MEISKEDILSKTNYGLNIYSHVLRQYYPGNTVLSLSGRDCQPTKNPFNFDKPTLKISIVDNCAVHYDLEEKEIKGDAITFAAVHYKLENQELFNKLNQAMRLQIGNAFNFYNPKEVVAETPMVIVKEPAIPVFSYFKNPVTNTIPYKEVNLLEIYQAIKGNSFKIATQTLRNIKDKKRAKEYKAEHFYYATFSGVFTKRTDKALQKHSGLITVDFDHVEDPDLLKVKLLQDQYFETELMFLSPSGDGLKWVIPIELSKATHLDYFKSISRYIFLTYQIKIDPSGKDISRACFLPHDAGIYINPKYA